MNPKAHSYTAGDVDLLLAVTEYLANREDIRDGGDGTPMPNEAMHLRQQLDEMLVRLIKQRDSESAGPNSSLTTELNAALGAVLDKLECRRNNMVNAFEDQAIAAAKAAMERFAESYATGGGS